MSAAPRRRPTRPARLVALAAALLSACDLGGPEGPARVLGTITGDPQLGAAVIDLSWEDVASLEGRGSTQVYAAPVGGTPDHYRAILVNPSGGDLRFTIELTRDRLYAPVITVESAVGTDDLPLLVGDLRVVLER